MIGCAVVIDASQHDETGITIHAESNFEHVAATTHDDVAGKESMTEFTVYIEMEQKENNLRIVFPLSDFVKTPVYLDTYPLQFQTGNATVDEIVSSILDSRARTYDGSKLAHLPTEDNPHAVV